tara:strand:+ start:5118 stop:5273 length:156 start_codon:yes stop_codon:yes gene_type:complete
MNEIKEAIKEYLNSWEECSYCDYMVKVELLFSDNHDNAICKECMIEEYGEA